MWRFTTAQSTGSSHLKTNLPCQDRLKCEVFSETTFVATLADGAGSAIQGERGAETAVETVIRFISDALKARRMDFPEILSESFLKAREMVFSTAKEQGIEPRDLATTLLAVIMGPEGGAAFQIGDGVIVVSKGEEEWEYVFWPQRGEFVNTTHFLTDEDAMDFMQIEPLEGAIKDVALMTDGLEMLALDYSRKSVFEPFFKGIFEPLHMTEDSTEVSNLTHMLEDFLSSERVRARTDDDTSLILATRR
jgi:hypothetical protein